MSALEGSVHRPPTHPTGVDERSIDIEQEHGRASHAALLNEERAGVPSEIGAEA